MNTPRSGAWETVHRAMSPDEREAIYRFRYMVYVDELHREVGGVDRDRRELKDVHDEDPTTVHLYVGSPTEILGVLRVRPWPPGAAPKRDADAYSMDLFPGISELSTAEFGRLMVRPSARGRLVMPSLLRSACEILTREHDTQLAFGSCRPGLVALYHRVGFRTYAGRIQQSVDGCALPIVIVYSDVDHLERVGAPFADLARARFGPDTPLTKRLTPSALTTLFRQHEAPVVTDPERVWLDLQSELLGTAEVPPVLRGLDEALVERLARLGLVLEVPAGTLVTRAGHVEREMFIVLDGTFEAFSGDHVFSRMTKGEVFGEVAFFRGTGERSASVRAHTDGRLVVVRRSVLGELGRTAPDAAQTLLFNLASVLADRVVRLSGETASVQRATNEQ